ncbi:MAG: GNAT family N-acetyltransferase, partial [Planctomycetota bacterium]
MPAAPVVLRTERLLLRPMEEGDIAFTVAALGDLEVSRHLAFVPHPYAESDARWWLDETRRRRADGSMDHFMIEPIEGGTPIGAIGLSA